MGDALQGRGERASESRVTDEDVEGMRSAKGVRFPGQMRERGTDNSLADVRIIWNKEGS